MATSPVPLDASSAHNVTNMAGPDNTGTTWYTDANPTSSTVLAVPGTTFGVSGASMFPLIPRMTIGRTPA